MLLAECMVCFETLESSKAISAAPCGHVLHYECWTRCLQSSAMCPKCRLPTDMNRLLRLYISYSEKEDLSTLENKIDELKVELSCKAVDCELVEKKLLDKTFSYDRLRTEMETLKDVETKMIKAVEILKEKETEIETLKRSINELQKDTAKLETLRFQTLELKKAKAELKKVKDQAHEVREIKGELEKMRKESTMAGNKSKEEITLIRKYQGVVEGLKECLHEYDLLKKSNQLVKKLKIFTDDISGDVRKDVQKDPVKYAEMFLEVKKFWSSVGKIEDEIKKSPKGCVIHLTGFPPNRKDVTKVDIQARMEYYNAKVAFVTYTRGGKEAFVRLKPSPKCSADQQISSAELVVRKLTEGKLRIKNFTVNAVVLQGEDELKFLRRSFNDRDRKTGRVDYELDFHDDSQEVSMLEYMMNLVAVA